MKIFLTILFLISGAALTSADELWFLDEHIFAKRIDDSSPVYIKNRYQSVTRQKLQELLPPISKLDNLGKNHLVYLADYKIPEYALPECTPQAIEFGTENAGFFGLSGWLNAPSVIHFPSTRVHPIPGRIDASNSFIHFGHHKKLSLNSSSDYYDACPDYLIRWFEIFTSDAQQQPPADQNEPGTELLSAGSHFFDFKNDRKRPGRGFLLDDFEIILMSVQQFFLTQELSDDDNNLPLDFDQMVVQIINPDGESERVYLHEPEWNEFISTLTGSTSQPLDDSLLPREAIIYSRRDIMNADLLLEAFAENTKDAPIVPGIHNWGGGQSTQKRKTSGHASSPATALAHLHIVPPKKRHINPGREGGDNPQDEGQISCIICGQAFLSLPKLTAHLKEHDLSELHPAEKEGASAPAKQIIPTTTEPEWIQFFSPETQAQLTDLLGGTNPAYWEPQAFVSTLIERTHDDLAWRYSEAAMGALEKNKPMPVPGIHFTFRKMLENLELFLSHAWLSKQDQEALKAFREELEALQRQGYPYFKSIEKSLTFSSIQQMFYFLAHPHEGAWQEDLEKSLVSNLHQHCDKFKIPRLGSISQVIELPWHILFEGGDASAVKRLNRGVWALLPFDIQRDIQRIINHVPTYRNKELFSVSFAELSVESLNLMAYLKIAPIGLLDNIYAFHDNQFMSCGLFPWHDLSHFRNTTQAILFSVNGMRVAAYHRVRLFYESKEKLAKETFHVTELLLFYFLHERVRNFDSEYIITDAIKFGQMLELEKALDFSRTWADLPADHIKWLESDELLRAMIALQTIHRGEIVEQKNIDATYDRLKAKIPPFSDVLRKTSDREKFSGYYFSCDVSYKETIQYSLRRLKDNSWEDLDIRTKSCLFSLMMFPDQIPFSLRP